MKKTGTLRESNDWDSILKHIMKNTKIGFSATPKRISRKQFLKMLKGTLNDK